MIASLAAFGGDYQGLDNIVLDGCATRASCDLQLVSSVLVDVSTDHTPLLEHIDTFLQLAGFVINADNHSNLADEVFVNHSSDSIRMMRPLQPNVTYEGYVQMTKEKASLWQGSVVILEGDKVTGVIVNAIVSQLFLISSFSLQFITFLEKLN